MHIDTNLDIRYQIPQTASFHRKETPHSHETGVFRPRQRRHLRDLAVRPGRTLTVSV